MNKWIIIISLILSGAIAFVWWAILASNMLIWLITIIIAAIVMIVWVNELNK